MKNARLGILMTMLFGSLLSSFGPKLQNTEHNQLVSARGG